MDKSDDNHVILMMDANKTIGKERLGLELLMEKTGLIDPFPDHTNIHEQFPCHINGSKRIDYILITQHTTRFIKAMGYLPF